MKHSAVKHFVGDVCSPTWAHKPFNIKRWTGATNGHVFIAVRGIPKKLPLFPRSAKLRKINYAAMNTSRAPHAALAIEASDLVALCKRLGKDPVEPFCCRFAGTGYNPSLIGKIAGFADGKILLSRSRKHSLDNRGGRCALLEMRGENWWALIAPRRDADGADLEAEIRKLAGRGDSVKGKR